MPDERADERVVERRTPESAAFVADVERAMAITARMNRLTYADAAEVRTLFEELTGRPVDDGFRLVPPFYSDGGRRLRVGERVFVNQGCTIYDFAGVEIGDDVLIGPHVSLVGSGHPVAPSRRRAAVVGRPIVVEHDVWLGAGATVVGGVRIGARSVVAAGAVVTRDVPPDTLVGGNPATVIRSIAGE